MVINHLLNGMILQSRVQIQMVETFHGFSHFLFVHFWGFFWGVLGLQQYTLPETNIAPENWWLEDEFPFRMSYFEVLCQF